MPNSYNGWPVLTSPPLDNSPIPGTGIKFAPGMLAGDVADVLLFVGTYVHYKIEQAGTPGCWGYSYRENRNANNWSCHASATAIDFSAPAHPNNVHGTWSQAEKDAIHWLINVYLEGVVQWGEDYTGTIDGMHFEIIKGGGDVSRVAAKIRREYGPRENWPAALTGGAPVQPPAPGPDGYRDIGMGGVTELGTKGEQVRRDQADLNDTGFTLTVDGYAGQDTVTRIRDFQYAAGLPLDGAMGPQTRAAIHKVPSWNNGVPVGGGYSALRWQQELKNHGWHIETDNQWGAHSEGILRQFQADKHIDVNGQRNYQTWTALFTQPK